MSPSWSTSRGREYRYYVCTRVECSGRDACSVRAVPAGTIEDFVVKHIRSIAADPVMLTRVAEIIQRRHAERVPAIEKELRSSLPNSSAAAGRVNACCRPSVAAKPAAT